jgi:Ca2+-binding EF-hand superfamily protein
MKKLITIGALLLASSAVFADEDLLATLDTDNDARISVEEAAADASLTAVFAEMDVNKDGYLTPSELEG